MQIMHIFGRYAFSYDEIGTALLFKNCVGVIKDKSWSVNILLIYSAMDVRIY